MSNINLDFIRQRLNKLQQSNKKSDLIWKPKVEETDIRIVPYTFQDRNPFIELYFHYEISNYPVLSPISYNRPDPIYEIAQKFKSTGSRDDWMRGKKLEPTLRTFAPIIIRGREAEGVKFWGFGKTVYESLLEHIDDPKWGDITDPVNGRDITVYTKQEPGKQFPTPVIRISPQSTPITNDRNILNTITNGQADFKDLYEEKSYEELKEILDKHLNPENYQDGEQAKNDTQSQPQSQSQSSSQPDTPSQPSSQPDTSSQSMTTDEVTNAFDKLFPENK